MNIWATNISRSTHFSQIVRRHGYVFIFWTPVKWSNQEPQIRAIKQSRMIFTDQDSWSRSQTFVRAICKWLPFHLGRSQNEVKGQQVKTQEALSDWVIKGSNSRFNDCCITDCSSPCCGQKVKQSILAKGSNAQMVGQKCWLTVMSVTTGNMEVTTPCWSTGNESTRYAVSACGSSTNSFPKEFSHLQPAVLGILHNLVAPFYSSAEPESRCCHF